jgi:hypothetical protein
VWLEGGRIVHIGDIDASSLIANIRAARATLDELVAAGRFCAQQLLEFEFLATHASVDEWLEFRCQNEATGKLSDEVIGRARAFLSEQPGVIVVRERSRALRLVRL